VGGINVVAQANQVVHKADREVLVQLGPTRRA
jgi:hypothetical protein